MYIHATTNVIGLYKTKGSYDVCIEVPWDHAISYKCVIVLYVVRHDNAFINIVIFKI